jgi:ankyrin repeat protein
VAPLPLAEARSRFINAATWGGGLEAPDALLAEYPALRSGDIHLAAIQGDARAVRRFLEQDPGSARATSPPYDADPLTSLCLSNYLRLDRDRTPAFLASATALLDAGADPKGGFWSKGDHPEFETALYGAAGVAHHPELTRLLLERGADPNDGEAVYHSPETDDIAAMAVLVESGRLRPENLALMLIRKHDWHDLEGARYLLSKGADPNLRWGTAGTATHQAIRRDNDLEVVALLLDHGADPLLEREGHSAIAMAAWRGRGDLLALFERRGFPVALEGVERLIAACARQDAGAVEAIVREAPSLVPELLADGGSLLSQFAATWNTAGVALLLDLGVPVDAPYAGDGYWGIAPDSTALHVAAWVGVAGTVQLLLQRGAPVNAQDAKGRTALQLAVRATVDSYWTGRRTPDAVRALLEAGATVAGVQYPSGYDAVDALLKPHFG